MAFNGDAALAFQIHAVEHLVLHILTVDGVGVLQQPIGKCAFAVIDMSNDAKITYIFHSINFS